MVPFPVVMDLAVYHLTCTIYVSQTVADTKLTSQCTEPHSSEIILIFTKDLRKMINPVDEILLH